MVWDEAREKAWRNTGIRPRVAVWDVPHVARFLEAVQDDPLFALWWLVALRGPRRGEIAGVRWEDIDLFAGELTIREQVMGRAAVRDVVTLVVEVCFAVVFGQALAAYLRRRDALQRDVMWVFTAMAVIFALDVWRRVAGPPPTWVSGASAVLLLAQPFLTLRMVARLRPVPVWLRRGALGGYVITAGPFITGATMPAPLVLAAVAVFVTVETAAAGFLYTEARRRSGSPRVRLRAAAAGTATFALAILASGAGAAGGRHAAVVAGGVALVVALVSASAYLVAFVPPRWLRRSWSTAAAYALTRRLLHAPAGEGPEQIWQRYADAVCDVAGVDFALVLLEAPGVGVREAAAARMDCRPDTGYEPEDLARLLATPSPMTTSPPARGVPPLAVGLAARVRARYVTAVPLGVDSRDRGALVVLNIHRRLFAADDVTVLGELGEQANLLAQRGGMLAEHERLNTELAASVDALSLAGKAKSDFLASMSHELRTPLNAIIGFSDLMDPDDADPGEQQRLVPAEWVRHIRTSGRHLLNLNNDILDLAKVEAGRIGLKPEPLPLPTTIAEVVTTLRPVSERKRLHISTDVPAITVHADRIRLRQVPDNLLSNAIKFTPEGGSVHLSATRTDTEVRITVADTGVGIAPEDQKTVFDEFTQVGDPAARQAGTGLGLTLTRRLVEAPRREHRTALPTRRRLPVHRLPTRPQQRRQRRGGGRSGPGDTAGCGPDHRGRPGRRRPARRLPGRRRLHRSHRIDRAAGPGPRPPAPAAGDPARHPAPRRRRLADPA